VARSAVESNTVIGAGISAAAGAAISDGNVGGAAVGGVIGNQIR
jgi:osmotically inducible lipoprotein OsmB